MSVLIKGMEMPESCFDCPISHFAYCRTIACGVTGKTISAPDCEETRLDSCPLVPVPPHGDLIDRDALKEAFCGNCFADEKPMECSEPCIDMRIILEAQTIIPAEEGET